MGKFKINTKILPSKEVGEGLHTLISCRTDYILSWYKVANENVRSAILLLRNDRISHAVFFLQQAIECLIKGLFLENGIAGPSDMEEIKHYPNKAFRTFYDKVQDNNGVKFCDLLLNVINKGKSFYEKLGISAQVANILTTDYNENLKTEGNIIATSYSPEALGLNPTASQEDCHKCAYKLYYYQYILNLLAYVFNHEIESNARYPQFVDDNHSITPSSLFDLNIKKNLSFITILLDNIVKEIANYPFNMVYWTKRENDKNP